MTIYNILKNNQTLIGQKTDKYLTNSGFNDTLKTLLNRNNIPANWKDRFPFPELHREDFAQKLVLPLEIMEIDEVVPEKEIIEKIKKYRKENQKKWEEFLSYNDSYKLYREAVFLKESEKFSLALEKFKKLPYKDCIVNFYISECYLNLGNLTKTKEILQNLLNCENNEIREKAKFLKNYFRS
jgi:tetratricopeptide (TPR) repeat protein